MSVPSDRPPVSLMDKGLLVNAAGNPEEDLEIELPENVFTDRVAMTGEDIEIISDGDDVIVDFDPTRNIIPTAGFTTIL